MEKRKLMERRNLLLQAFKRIEKEHGYLSPDIVLEDARPNDSILHSFFDWNDATAAHKYRKWQARQLINEIKVSIQGKRVQAYHSVTVEIEGKRSEAYLSVERVMDSEALSEQLLVDALMELEHWQRKYDSLKELKDIINQEKVGQLKKQVKLTIPA